jgi:hypothetical protein
MCGLVRTSQLWIGFYQKCADVETISKDFKASTP